MSAPPLYGRLGLRVVEVGEGTATVDLCPSGGAEGDGEGEGAGECAEAPLALIAALAQAAMEQALGPGAVAFDLKVSRVRALPAGATARAVATVVHSGRTTAVASCRVTAGAGPDAALVATASGTASLPRRAR